MSALRTFPCAVCSSNDQDDDGGADGLECQRRERPQHHRRRFLLACLGLLAGLALISSAAVGANYSFSTKDLLVGLFGLAILAYFGWMASREWRHARIAD